ncbi:50S ribosomal protein L24 [Anaeromicrobium sediminis]|uniref:Large ribosomal subunit protein uL24 n=1 Tax=Anaeromicrobium sediminis TaxID=1478221 RepID=A0A267MF23_9FIRM|nr:50S ribosomal protein L24 [Anaeromicrobium sediminis]PAB58184.1 50S ribosomal protein L24 [Anaeromicrobium sediminis]
MHVKKGDTVVVITGKDKGKKGKVLEALPKKSRVIVEGVNIQKKHQKPNAKVQQGGIMEQPGAIHVSNVMLWDEKAKAPTRVGFKIENGKKVRVSKKSGEII